MASLAPALRKKLEDAVKEARDVAEAGARAALEQLAVHAAEPFSHLSPEDRELRNRLRARARQLGDGRDTRTGAHQIDHLVVECAYEHWHRMLFARFLAENGVLMANSEALGIENTPVTLEECEELAADEGAANGWELAGRYASKMLPQIFRPDAPVLAVHLPPERQRRLEQILAELSPETFKASDALGWVYQFWQAKKKDEVNASGVKIGADELPAVTQLFTEPYMVEFLLHNTLGAWWVGRHGRDSLPVEVPYLRLLDDGTPAAGTFKGWPNTTRELTVLDPCCGSGHFLVAAFEILVRFRMAEEELTAADACTAVLRDNVHGLEIDERCTQIAAFALALAAWTFPNAGGYRVLPELHIACSGLAPRVKKDEWIALAGDDVRMKNGMDRLFDLFRDAPVLGSMIDVNAVGMTGQQQQLGVARFEELSPLLAMALSRTRAAEDVHRNELAVSAKGIVTAASILGRKYTVAITNVPYLRRLMQEKPLRDYGEIHHPKANTDLATMMIQRICSAIEPGGSVAVVSPRNWLFLTSYKHFRKDLLKTWTWDILATLGPRAFETIGGEKVDVTLLVVSNSEPTDRHILQGLDAAAMRTPVEKAGECRAGALLGAPQSELRSNPDSIVTLTQIDRAALFGTYVDCFQGLSTGDVQRFGRSFWEVTDFSSRWRVAQAPPDSTGECRGRELALDWHSLSAGMNGSAIRGREAWGKRGVAIGQMSALPATLYTGELFVDSTPVIIPKRPEYLPAVWAFCASPDFNEALREINPKLSVNNGYVGKLSWDYAHWKEIAGDQLPEAISSDGSQWAFEGRVNASRDPLQVAVARLLGYRWPKQSDDGVDDFMDADGVVCLPAVRGEQAAADRVLALLAAAYGAEWTTRQHDALLTAVNAKGKGLDWWLQNKFFEQHCQLFRHRPFIWHIWDGIKKDGFGALVNYHKLDRKLLETLTYTYLGDWIRRQQDDAGRNVDGAAERLDAARRLQQSLELILEGEKPHDIFVRWKALHEQPIGWEPDLNDGVRVNIRPFMSVPDVDKKGAGVLRYKPNIHWKKDRGTDPDDAPWFELGPSYGESKGARINDHHLSLAEKRAARERAGGR